MNIQTATNNHDDLTRMARVEQIDQMMRAAGARRTLYGAVLANKLGLNQSDLECLFIITLNKDVTPGKLVDETGLTSGAITGLVDRIERAGYITRQRDPKDRRRVFLKPVQERIAEIRAINKLINAFWLEEMTRFDDHALDVLEDFAERNFKAAVQSLRKLRDLEPPGRK